MKKYNSKIDRLMLVPIVILMGGGTVFMLVLHLWLGVAILFVTSMFITHLFLTTFYQIDKHILRIKSGFLMDMKIDIMTIKEVVDTRDAISAPALSYDRMYIKYNKTNNVIVSPREKEAFIEDLLKINPSIQVISSHRAS